MPAVFLADRNLYFIASAKVSDHETDRSWVTLERYLDTTSFFRAITKIYGRLRDNPGAMVPPLNSAFEPRMQQFAHVAPSDVSSRVHESHVVTAPRSALLCADSEFDTNFSFCENPLYRQLGNQSGTLNRPKGIAADSDGNLYVVDALFETVQVFNTDGQLLYYFGSTGSKPGQFQLPAGISIDSRNIIYVADSYNRRVQVFRYRRVDE